MRRIKIIFSVIVILVTFSCYDVTLPDIDETDPYLVVEGKITTNSTVHSVHLCNSRSFDYGFVFPAVSNAFVQVYDNEGNSVIFHESDFEGWYYTDPKDEFRAEIGKTYTLHIVIEGVVYESIPQTVVESAEIKNIYCEYDRETFVTEDAYGDPWPITNDGINIIAETDGILPHSNFYLYSWLGFEQHHSVLDYGGPNFLHLYCHRRLHAKYQGGLVTGNADEYGNYEMRNKKILFIVTDDMLDFIPGAADSMELISTQFQGLFFELNQWSLSADAFEFYKGAEEQLNAGGRLFDPAISQLTGNIFCKSDLTMNVLGVFYAADISVKHAYLYINLENETYSELIDGFPNLYLDSCYVGSRPQDWYVPPI
ncbi:MAG: DUF4249 domain-containing protein [Bacteroidales bacterium]|nr:DUF4249 domain-containing protein [Bacteroidales bacterium]